MIMCVLMLTVIYLGAIRPVKMKYLPLVLVIFLTPVVINAESTFFDNSNDAFVIGPATVASAEAPSSQLAKGSGGDGGSGGCAQGQIRVNGTCQNETGGDETMASPEAVSAELEPGKEAPTAEENKVKKINVSAPETSLTPPPLGETSTELVNETFPLPAPSPTGRVLLIISLGSIILLSLILWGYLLWRRKKNKEIITGPATP